MMYWYLLACNKLKPILFQRTIMNKDIVPINPIIFPTILQIMDSVYLHDLFGCFLFIL